ncbi:MAG: exodeoxyribonuclease VII large subunit [Phycisphaerae bacterium]|nr:exodeoxyribonuclease VII large subunit [Phycisphaerae bacterium]MDD5380790.1 exodeoxyribonuclease VII large subunit [Phycisphaerae bacterium]
MKNGTKIYTVSQINTLIKGILENNLPGRLTITGEITDWKLHHSGHCYFLLKDEEAVLPCVMWKSSFSKLKFRPENGMAVFGTGFIDVYEPQGKFQFYVERIEPAGVGALQLAFEQMVRKLAAEGLFEEEHKKPIPPYPERIGILTSESGAAIEDIKDSIWNRWPCVKLFLYPVQVQGEGAAAEIAAAIRDVNRRNKKLKLDILIVGRGGGSMEDLWAFNEEVLARAIFDSKIPVISAVGHEVDTTIADLVADRRASTPTKAGVVAVPDMRQVLEDLENKKESLNRNIILCVQDRGQLLDDAFTGLAGVLKELMAEGKDKLHSFYEQVIKIEPHRLLGRKTVELNDWKNRAGASVKAIMNKCGMQFETQKSRLTGLNPKSVLQRGYSITTNKRTGLLVKNLADIQIEDCIITELAGENLIESKVTNKQNRNK